MLSGVVVTGANALPTCVITKAFAPQHGRTLNFGRFSRGMQSLNGWYEDRGIFGQVDAPPPPPPSPLSFPFPLPILWLQGCAGKRC